MELKSSAQGIAQSLQRRSWLLFASRTTTRPGLLGKIREPASRCAAQPVGPRGPRGRQPCRHCNFKGLVHMVGQEQCLAHNPPADGSISCTVPQPPFAVAGAFPEHGVSNIPFGLSGHRGSTVQCLLGWAHIFRFPAVSRQLFSRCASWNGHWFSHVVLPNWPAELCGPWALKDA